jgi:hypothetical protein
MKAIQVKYLAPTNTKGSRYKAFIGDGISLTIDQDYSLDYPENMMLAAKMLAQKLEWKGEFVGGTLPNGDMVFIMKKSYREFTA